METRKHTSGIIQNVIVPISSLVVALAGILLGYHSQLTQVKLAEFEIVYKIKQVGYGGIMSESYKAFFSGASRGDIDSLTKHLGQAWSEYYTVQPLIPMSEREKVFWLMTGLDDLMYLTYERKIGLEDAQTEFHRRHKKLGDKLEMELAL